MSFTSSAASFPPSPLFFPTSFLLFLSLLLLTFHISLYICCSLFTFSYTLFLSLCLCVCTCARVCISVCVYLFTSLFYTKSLLSPISLISPSSKQKLKIFCHFLSVNISSPLFPPPPLTLHSLNLPNLVLPYNFCPPFPPPVLFYILLSQQFSLHTKPGCDFDYIHLKKNIISHFL